MDNDMKPAKYLFFPIKNGEWLRDSQGKPRVYNGLVSVKARLPEDGEPVLVTYLATTNNRPLCNLTAYWSLAANGWNGGWVWYDDESDVTVEITHWMPLPKPAKEV